MVSGQYSGTVGGIALCQVAVTLTYATGRGHALIGRMLYLPEGCAAASASAGWAM
jgi:SRSO17 transposase